MKKILLPIALVLLMAGTCQGQRIISLSPIITETLYLLGAQDSLIANTVYCTVPEQARHKDKIGNLKQINVEKILMLRPDLVIASPLTREKQIRILENQGIKVLTLTNPLTFEQMCGLTMELGQITGHISQARQIVDKAKVKVAEVQKSVAGLPAPRVFFQIGLKPLHTVNKDLFIHDFMVKANGINIAENAPRGIYSREKVVKENPDVILIATMGSSKAAGEDEARYWAGFKGMNAARTQRIFVLPPEVICSPSPFSFASGLETIAGLLHPEAK